METRRGVRIHRSLRDLYNLAISQEWTVTQRKNGHLLWRSPKGAVVYTSSSPSDHRAPERIRRDLIRNELKMKGDGK